MGSEPTIVAHRGSGVPEEASGAYPVPSSLSGTLQTDFRLVRPDEVAELLDDSSGSGDLVLLEAHFTSIDHPLDPDRPPLHHIPGAIQVHPSYLEAGLNREKYYPFYDCPDDGNILQGYKLFVALERLGITHSTHVVVYGTEPDGTMAAARLVWGLMYAGVENVSLLDGGIDAWVMGRGTTSSKVRTAWDLNKSQSHRAPRSTGWRLRPEYLASRAGVHGIASGLDPAPTKLVDVRRRGEWDGTLTDYYQFCAKAGHIPNAIHQGDWGNLLEARTHKIAPTLPEVAARWRRLGIIDSDTARHHTSLIFYCGTGWRSSIAFLVAHLLGLRAKNYDDGFYGWSWDDANEVVMEATS